MGASCPSRCAFPLSANKSWVSAPLCPGEGRLDTSVFAALPLHSPVSSHPSRLFYPFTAAESPYLRRHHTDSPPIVNHGSLSPAQLDQQDGLDARCPPGDAHGSPAADPHQVGPGCEIRYLPKPAQLALLLK